MLELFAPSFLRVWNQMLMRNLRTVGLSQDVLRILFRHFVERLESEMLCIDFPESRPVFS